MTYRILSCLIALAIVFSVTGPMSASQPAAVAPVETAATAPTQAAVSQALRANPVMFIENVGQFVDGARFQVRGGIGTMWLAEDALWITIMARSEAARPDRAPRAGLPAAEMLAAPEAPRTGANIRLSFPGANAHPRIEPFNRLDTVVSYFIGNDPDKWRPDVPVWGGVRYVDLYPGVDLEIIGEGGQMVQRLSARPGADLSAVQLRVEGTDAVAVDGDALRLSTAAGDFAVPLLRVDGTQLAGAKVQARGAQAFDIAAPFAPAHVNRQSAIANPQSVADNPADLLYSTFLGSGSYDFGSAIAVDGAGSAYVTGYTPSTGFPTTPGAFDPSYNGNGDAFVVKLNPAGSGLTYATFLGGDSGEQASAIAVGRAGVAYIAGYTDSSDFPTTSGAFDPSYNGNGDAFVVRLNPLGNALEYSTYLGGNGGDWAFDLGIDRAGNIYISGMTGSRNFPATPGAFDTRYNDLYVAKLNTSGSALVYATFLGGSAEERSEALIVDEVGRVYVTGSTRSTDFPVTPDAFDTSYNGSATDIYYYPGDAFVVRLDTTGSTLEYATFIGGSGNETGYAIAVDETGHAYLTGKTSSMDFPTSTGVFDSTYNGGDDGDAFLVKVDADGKSLVYATFLGGWASDIGSAIALDQSDRAYVAGHTWSSDFPITFNALDQSCNCGASAVFVSRLDVRGNLMEYSTFLGGSSWDYSSGIAVDRAGRAYVTGETYSSNFPTTPGAFDTSFNGDRDAFVVKLALGSGAVYAVSGNVTDGTNQPLAGVTVSAGAGGSTTTDSNGNYMLSGLVAGTHTLTPSKSGYTFSPASRTVTVPPDATGQDFVGTPIPDLTVAYIEINQAVQDRQNSVALVAHKPTVIRAYADIGSQVTSVDHITATLKVRRGGTVLDTLQSRGEITAHQNPKPERVYDSLNFFLLNTDYLTGTLDFEVTLNPAHVVSESNYTNNAKSQPGTFQEQRAVLIRYVSIHYAPPGYTGPMDPGSRIAQGDEFLRWIYPLAPSNVDYRPLQAITFTLPVNQGSNGSTLLAELGDLWQECNCDYVYGWLPPSVYSGNGLGQRPGQVAFGNDTDGRWRRTFAHELGHNLGADHTQGQGGDSQAPDTLAADQEFGFNVSGQAVKYRRPDGGLLRDVMFAGEVEANAWVTPYFWRAAFDEFKAPAAAMAAQAAGEYLLASGFILREGGGSLRPLFRTTRTSPPPSLQGSEYCLSQQDAVGQNLASDCFDVYFDADSGSSPPDTMPFHVAVPWISATDRVVLSHGATVLDEQMVSTHSPTVQVLSPNGGGSLSGAQAVSWMGADLDGDPLTYSVLYSNDNGASWLAVSPQITSTTYLLDFDLLGGGGECLIRVRVTDGINTAYDDSDAPFHVASKSPQAFIYEPGANNTLRADQPIRLAGTAYDLEDGALSETALHWSSNRDGDLGTGNEMLKTLSLGEHTLTFTATDSDGNAATSTVKILVKDPKPPLAPAVAVLGGENVQLTWPHIVSDTNGIQIAVTHYEVWRGTTPYFHPYDESAPGVEDVMPPALAVGGDPVSYGDAGLPDSTRYYVVRAISADGLISEFSKRFGVFNVTLTPGTSP